jgi:hypothetical protein
LGGLLLWFLSWLVWRAAVTRRTIGLARFRIPVALLTVAASAVLWLRIETTPAAQSLSWKWQPLTVAGAVIQWRADPWNWFVVLLILVLTAAVLLLTDHDAPLTPAGGSAERTLWLGAAAALFVCSASLITLASCWLILDAMLALRLHPARQSEPAGRAWALLTIVTPLLLLVLAMAGENGIGAPLIGGRFARSVLTWLWLLGLLRVGVYPLHFWITSPGRMSNAAQAAVHLLGATTGIWFLARVQALAGLSLTRQPEWAALGAFALLGTAIAAWTAEEDQWRWRWIAVNRACIVMLAAYVSGEPGPAAFAWSLAAFGLGAGLLAVAPLGQGGWRWRAPALLGALVLWGLPGTVGFLARSALIFPTELPIAAGLFVVLLVGEILLVAALWESVRRAGTSDAEEQEAMAAPVPPTARPYGVLVRLTAATLLLAAPAIVWGLFPQRLAALGGFALPDGATTLAQVIATARRSVWIGLVISGLGGVALGIWRTQIFSQVRGWQQGLGAIVGLEWLYRLVVGGLRVVGGGLQYFATLGEGEGYLGWLALAGLILWVLLRG